MMEKNIKILDKEVINKISAGEVVEKPASIVKELVENSIDAGASNITIEICGGGIEKICVTDNGCGIKKDEVILAFTPHATSKLSKFEDLDLLNTMGFRGEALATISAVSKVTLITKTDLDDTGIKCEIISGNEVSRCDIACTTGTKIEVKDVFYNTPARLKFLRKPKSEEGDITNYVQKLILSNSNISFKYIVDNKLIYNTTGGSVIDNIYSIYGREMVESLLEVSYQIGSYKISGYISKPEYNKANRTYQNLFVNTRYCVNPLVSSAVSSAYENFTMKGKFPVYVLFIDLPQNELDVNVHPNKLEVKFTDTQKIYKLCLDGVFKALADQTFIKQINESSNDNKDEPTNLQENITYTAIDKSEGISYKQNAEVKQCDEALGPFSKYFTENDDKKNGTYSFKKTKNLVDEQSFLKIPEEVVIKENVLNKTEEINKYEKAFNEQKFEQVSADNVFEQDYRVIGKVFNTYLILECNDSMYLIDQHAAHERLMYDKLTAEINNNNLNVQNLLFPYIFNVNSAEYDFITNNIETLNEFGIEICEFGNLTFKVNSVPLMLSEISLKDFISEMLSNLYGLAKSPREVLKEKFMQMACKSAVKGGDDLKDIEIKVLLEKLKDETKVLLCPHGRPIVVEVNKKQIEKWFKRIV